MIVDRSSYRECVRADLAAYGLRSVCCGVRWRLPALRFVLRLRRVEYLTNVRGFVPLRRVRLFWNRCLNHCLATRLGFSIPINVFGPGLCIVHYGTIVVSPYAKVGANCRLHPMTCIGEYNGAPTLGDNVYVGPGAKIYGKIRIGNNVAIGANAVVNRDFGDDVTLAGVPARVVSEVGAKEKDIFPKKVEDVDN